MALLLGTQEKYRYQTCRDEDCELRYCRVYKEGLRDDHSAGYGAGYAAGRAEGYARATPRAGPTEQNEARP